MFGTMRSGLLLVALIAALAASACGGQQDERSAASGGLTVSGGSGRFAGGKLNPPKPTPNFTLTDQSGCLAR